MPGRSTIRAKRAATARKALKISPDCADAYVLMAEIATTPAQALELYRRGVAAGERALGQRAFVEDVGHFWDRLETRLATCGLAPAWHYLNGFAVNTMKPSPIGAPC